VLAFAPFYWWPLILVSVGALFWAWSRAANAKEAALIGFVWGLGLFLAGVSWLYVALHVYGNMPAPMAVVSIFLFCCYLSLFPMLAGVVVVKLRGKTQVSQQSCVSLISLLLVMPASFVAFEMLRGWFMTGFPWLIIGYTQTPGGVPPLFAGVAPVLGVFGISWLLALLAGACVAAIALALALVRERTAYARRRCVAVTGASALVCAGAIALGVASWSTPAADAVDVSLVQGNVDQAQKWREETLAATMNDYLSLVQTSRGKLIVLPETAIPRWLHNIPDAYLQALRNRAIQNGGDVIVGVPMIDRDNRQFNSAISLGVSPTQTYSKSHLVAFGEFIPPLFSWAYQWLDVPLSGFTPGAETQAPMRLFGRSVAVNICYEDTFGREIARPLPEAELLVNISNMAWYGRSLAAEQHLQFSQMRSLETSRWMLRATNTGLTAAVNERGVVVRALPQFTSGVLEVSAIPRQGTTPYARWKDAPVLVLLVIALAVAVVTRGKN
jgi:apolipoprotein N-acyltransferase